MPWGAKHEHQTSSKREQWVDTQRGDKEVLKKTESEQQTEGLTMWFQLSPPFSVQGLAVFGFPFPQRSLQCPLSLHLLWVDSYFLGPAELWGAETILDMTCYEACFIAFNFMPWILPYVVVRKIQNQTTRTTWNEHLVVSTEKHMMGVLILQILMLIVRGLCKYKHNFYHFDVWIKPNVVVASCSMFALLWMNFKHRNMSLTRLSSHISLLRWVWKTWLLLSSRYFYTWPTGVTIAYLAIAQNYTKTLNTSSIMTTKA